MRAGGAGPDSGTRTGVRAYRPSSGHGFNALRAGTEPAGIAKLAAEKLPVSGFYVERADSIDVWRVLHSQRDIPAWLLDEPLA